MERGHVAADSTYSRHLGHRCGRNVLNILYCMCCMCMLLCPSIVTVASLACFIQTVSNAKCITTWHLLFTAEESSS